VQAELDYLRYLSEQQYPAVQPTPSLQGSYVEEITSTYAAFYAVTFKAAKGKHISIESLTGDQIQAWGELLGQLHQLSVADAVNGKRNRPEWTDVLTLYATWLPEIAENSRHYLKEARQWLAHLPLSLSNYGLIHWDFEPDNLTWQNGHIQVMDFDDAAYFWYAADIAFALDDVLDEPYKKARYIVTRFLDGYQSVRSLDREWLSRLPFFVRLMRVLKAARVTHAYANTHPELDPPWLSEMRKRHSDFIKTLEMQCKHPFWDPLSTEEAAVWDKVL
jgi:Ser/Thr protein kinase RdoA (MazF antagonist)